jgi:oligopeptide/dipeptide ABC transporter ATP-binding protein
VLFKGNDMVRLTAEQLRAGRWRDYAVVMQSAMNALNPVKTVSAQFEDVMRAHGQSDRHRIRERSQDVLRLVGIDTVHLKSFPHQLSGGMRQRVMIAMALMCEPRLVIADEPTSALDVTVQAQILALLRDVRAQFGTAIVLISHDLGVVAGIAERIVVMYAGRVVESAPTRELLGAPRHPYTALLIQCAPSLHRARDGRMPCLTGQPPEPTAEEIGCAFAPRCPRASVLCREQRPPLMRIDALSQVACHHPLHP